MGKFIYVFSKEACECLVKQGFKLLKSDDKSGVYILENRQSMSFALSEMRYLESDTLTF